MLNITVTNIQDVFAKASAAPARGKYKEMITEAVNKGYLAIDIKEMSVGGLDTAINKYCEANKLRKPDFKLAKNVEQNGVKFNVLFYTPKFQTLKK